MFVETITYKGYNGETYTEDFMFNLSEAELIKMNYTTPGGMKEFLTRISKEKDTVKLYNNFENLLLMSYGRISLDGKRFEKSAAMREELQQSDAYSKLLKKLLGDAKYAAKFVQGIMPENSISDADVSRVTAEVLPANVSN